MFERIPKIASHSTGKETEFSIKNEEDPKDRPNLSAANYGNISRVTARVERGEHFREKSLVLKHFFASSGWSPEWKGGNYNRDRAIDAYNALKLIGLKNIPATFRAVGESEVVMTDFNTGGNLAFANNKIKESRTERIKSITNLDQVIEQMKHDIIKLSLYGIELRGDESFIIAPKQGGDVEIKIVIADLELMYIKNLQKLTDVEQIEEIYKKNAATLAGVFCFDTSNNYFPSKDYCKSLEDQARNLLLSSDYHSEIKEHLSDELKPSIRRNIPKEEAQLRRELSKIGTEVGREIYADVVKNRMVHMGYDEISLPMSINGSDGHVVYMVCKNENGNSFGVDTLFIGYEDTNHEFKTKEVAQTRSSMHKINSQIENGLLILNIDMGFSDPIQITHPLDALKDIQLISNLDEMEKNMLDMYKENRGLVKDFPTKQGNSYKIVEGKL